LPTDGLPADRPAILAIHGGMGGYDQSLLLAQALFADLGQYRTIAVSRPGYLGTSLAIGTTPDEQADAHAALLDALGVAEAIVVAVSAGGPSALRFAARHPGRCRALVMVSACTGALATPPQVIRRMGKMRLIARVPGISSLLKWRVARNPDSAARRAILHPALRARTMQHPEAGVLLRALQSSVLDRMSERLPGTLNDIRQFADLAPLPEAPLALPALIIHGDADPVVPFAHAERVRQRLPNAGLLAIPGGEHLVLFTHLDAIRQKMRGLVA
jgi:pimeloyl-ACP methyl ester carboxylesterase